MSKRFKFLRSPVARATVTFAAMAAATSVTQAGPGFGDAFDINNTPFIIQSYFASSPSGARLWDPATAAPAAYDPANQAAYAAAVAKLYPAGYPGTGKALRKFVDPLPLLGKPQTLSDGVTVKYIPVAVPAKWVKPDGTASGDDYYEIASVEYREKFHSDLKKASTLRGYVQIDQFATHGLTAPSGWTSKAVPLTYPDGSPIMVNKTDAAGKLAVDGAGAYVKVQAKAVDNPHYLGPIIQATSTNAVSVAMGLQGAPTRIKFHNLLPAGRATTTTTTIPELVFDPASATNAWVDKTVATVVARNGDMFLPLDPSVPGSGFGPDGMHTYTQNRTNIHLHGGDTPWISDGGPHTWIAPIGENDASVAGSIASGTPEGLPLDPSLAPDFLRGPGALNVPDMNDPGPGAMTYYFPNGQSARMEWYHDHSVGITRLNAYAGLASAYFLTDATEQKLIADKVIPGADATIPLILQEKTFVPDDILLQDARWDTKAWGEPGDLWYPHVYETVQDPNQATAFNSVGRWHWGPWFWPSYPSAYNLPSGAYGDVTLTPEAWMDTPLVNGVAYPTMTVEPKPYRFKILNASNDRTMTFNMFVADGTVHAPVLDPAGNPVYQTAADGTPVLDANGAKIPLTMDNTEVAMVPVQLWTNPCAAGVTKSDGNCTPDIWTSDVYGHAGGVPDPATQGPTIFQIGNEGGLLPGVAIKDATPVNYLLDKGRAAVLNVDFGTSGLHIGNAERADIVVDFSKYAGKTLIVYNDSGAPVPAADPRNEYFTGYGDNSATGGAEDTRPGYGPNTRTIMQIKVAAAVTTPGIASIETDGVTQRTAAAFTTLDGKIKQAYAVAQETPVVAQSAYNAALGKTWTDTKAFASVYNGSIKSPSFDFVPGTPNAAFNGILVQSQGSGYTRTPSVTISRGAGDTTGTGATAKATLKIDKFRVINGGSGYATAPIITVVAVGQGSGVTANTSLKVSGIKISSAGANYASATVTFQAAPRGFVTATGTAVITNGAITGINITNPGSGYAVMPTVTITGTAVAGTALVAAKATSTGSVDVITMTLPDPTNPLSSGGGGYNDLSTAASEPGNPAPGLLITFTAPPAGGTAPTAGATGRVFDVTLGNAGSGYTAPPTAAILPSPLEPNPAGIVAATAAADTTINPTKPVSSYLVKTKAIQELFDPTYGRLNATFGTEIPYNSALTQTTIPLGYVDAPTEEIADGETQIWKITHNGVDTHPIHFHLVNVQLINRVGWDNFITPPEPNELGWKETIKMSPLEDVIVAVRAKKPKLPGFGLPSSVRLLDPSQAEGSLTGFTQVDPYTGAPATMANVITDFGWEYVWHCHILGHEENDFMRPISFHSMDAVPDAPTGLTLNASSAGGAMLTWVDPTPGGAASSLGSAKGEIGFRVERASVAGAVVGAYVPVGTLTSFPSVPGSFVVSINTLANATSYTDDTVVLGSGDHEYRVVAVNTAGETASAPIRQVASLVAPSGLSVVSDTASSVALKWTDNSSNEIAFDLRWTSATAASGSASFGSNVTTGTATGLAANTVYTFAVTARDFNGGTAVSNTATGTTAPVAVTSSPVVASVGSLTLNWSNANPNLGALSSVVVSGTVGGVALAQQTFAGAATGTAAFTGVAQAVPYSLTVTVSGAGGSAVTTVTGTTAGAILNAATGARAQLVSLPLASSKFAVNWVDTSQGETGYQVQVCNSFAAQCSTATTLSATPYPGANAAQNRWYPVAAASVAYTAPLTASGAASAVVSIASQVNFLGSNYYFRVLPLNGAALGPVSNVTATVNMAAGTVAAPTGVSAVSSSAGTALVSWTDAANNNSGYTVQARRTGGVASVTLASGGSRYVTAPAVVISAPVAGGVQATAHAVVSPVVGTTGGVVSIVIDNAGSGYTARPTVTVTGGNRNAGGTNASATGTAIGNLGANVWITAYAATTPATTAGNVSNVTTTGLLSGWGYQFQVRADGVPNGAAASAFVTSGTGVAVVK